MYTHAERPMRLTTPLGEDALLLAGMQAHEAISELFHFQLEMVAPNQNTVDFSRMLGAPITVEWDTGQGQMRYFNGITSRFSQAERTETMTRYTAEVVPRFWLLTRRARSRIFQHKTVPEILDTVLEGLDKRVSLLGTYEPRDYCVQYRETDFQFASRLMEEEGIFYFFEHTDSGHTLVLGDNVQAHPDMGSVIYEELLGGTREEERVWRWEKTQELRSGKYTLWDHCFELPGKNLEANRTIIESVEAGPSHSFQVGGNDQLEIYDYPGGYAQRFDGVEPGGGDRASDIQKIFQDNQRTVDLRMQAEAAVGLVIDGGGNGQQLCAGFKFDLTRHFSDDGTYVLTSVDHVCRQPVGTERQAASAFQYENRFRAIPAGLPFRPQRVTPAPVVRGSQTATVVGPDGEEIYPDKYGRVRVQFHWDREGQKDVNSSCWVRVATLWAGKQWGMVHIPRIGQEVVVDFLEGDPDRPIIVGSVYNADQMPPYELPANKTQSGVKSRSSKWGGSEDFNEIRFEDKAGSEEIFMHAQKDLTTEVEHDEKRTVDHDRVTEIKNDDTLTVKHNRTATVENDDTLTVNNNRSSTIQMDDTLKVNKNRSSTVAMEDKEEIGTNQTIKVGVKQSVTIGAGSETTVGGTRTTTIAASDSLTVGAALSITAGGGVQITSAAPISITAPVVTLTGILQVVGVVQATSIVSPTYSPGVGNII